MKFASLVDRISGTGTDGWAVNFAAWEAQERGEDVIVLSVGDPDFPTPRPIVDAAIAALEAGDTHYTEINGRRPLRQAIADRFTEHTGGLWTADNVMVMAGTQQSMFATGLCLFETGDEVVIPNPMYLTYEATLRAGGADIITTEQTAEDGFRLDPAELDAVCTDNTRAIVITTPNNPTGTVASVDELEAVAEIAKERDLWVLADEVYGELVFEGRHHSIAAVPGMAERTVTLSSLSKSHAMTGWRIGWAIGPTELINHCATLGMALAYGLPGFVQEAALEAVTSQHGAVEEMRTTYRRRRDLVHVELEGVLPVLVPQAGMYVMADVRAYGMSGLDFAWALFRATGVSVVDAGSFGPAAAGWIRIAFTLGEDELREACRRIAAFVATLEAT